MRNELFLEIGPGHNLWALESEYTDYMEQLGDRPFGNCLEIGLGLGIASRCILTFPKVSSLTTIEVNKDIINAHTDIINYLDTKTDKWLPYNSDIHTIINGDGLSYMVTTKNKYDFIFLDFYKNIDENTLPEIKDMVMAARICLADKGTILGWFDPQTPTEFVDEFFEIFR
jgi:spermidine synthase